MVSIRTVSEHIVKEKIKRRVKASKGGSDLSQTKERMLDEVAPSKYKRTKNVLQRVLADNDSTFRFIQL